MQEQQLRIVLHPKPTKNKDQTFAYGNFAVKKSKEADIIWGFDLARNVVIPFYGREKIEEIYVRGVPLRCKELVLVYDSRIITPEGGPFNPLELEFVTVIVEKAKGRNDYQAPEEPLTFPALLEKCPDAETPMQPLPKLPNQKKGSGNEVNYVYKINFAQQRVAKPRDNGQPGPN